MMTSWVTEALKQTESLNISYTENYDISYKTTNSYCLDAYTGFVRGVSEETLESLIKNAFKEDSKLTLKIVLYTYAARIGKDERDIGLYLINWILNNTEEYDNCLYLINEIPNLGRYKDLIYFCDNKNNKISKYSVKFFAEELLKCKYNIMMGNNDKISLVSKWAPSEKSEKRRLKNKNNNGNNVAHMISQYLKPELDLNSALRNYRKILSYCRSDVGLDIPEKYMTEKKNIKNYEKLSAGFIKKHAHYIKKGKNIGNPCWLRKQDNWEKYLNDLKDGKVKINTQGGKQSLVDLVSEYISNNSYSYDLKGEESIVIEEAITTIFESIKQNVINKRGNLDNWLIVPDFSGSMFDNKKLPFRVACTFALIYSHMNENNHYKDLIMSFSDKPFLVKLSGKSWYDRLNDMINKLKNKIGYSTNFDSVIDKVIEISEKSRSKPPKIILVSDMQTNSADRNYNKHTFMNRMKNKYEILYEKLGYNKSDINNDFQMILVNVNGCYNNKSVLENDIGVSYISGIKQTIVEDILIQGKIDNPYESMLKVLEKFDKYTLLLKKK